MYGIIRSFRWIFWRPLKICIDPIFLSPYDTSFVRIQQHHTRDLYGESRSSGTDEKPRNFALILTIWTYNYLNFTNSGNVDYIIFSIYINLFILFILPKCYIFCVAQLVILKINKYNIIVHHGDRVTTTILEEKEQKKISLEVIKSKCNTKADYIKLLNFLIHKNLKKSSKYYKIRQ